MPPGKYKALLHPRDTSATPMMPRSSRVNVVRHLTRRQSARLFDEWVTTIVLQPEDYGFHSLRRTNASIMYKANGNLRAISILLGHSKIENTVRCLAVDVDDALSPSEATEI